MSARSANKLPQDPPSSPSGALGVEKGRTEASVHANAEATEPGSEREPKDASQVNGDALAATEKEDAEVSQPHRFNDKDGPISDALGRRTAWYFGTTLRHQIGEVYQAALRRDAVEPPLPATQDDAVRYLPYAPPPPARKRRGLRLLLVAGSLVLVGIGIVAIYSLTGGPNAEQTASGERKHEPNPAQPRLPDSEAPSLVAAQKEPPRDSPETQGVEATNPTEPGSPPSAAPTSSPRPAQKAKSQPARQGAPTTPPSKEAEPESQPSKPDKGYFGEPIPLE